MSLTQGSNVVVYYLGLIQQRIDLYLDLASNIFLVVLKFKVVYFELEMRCCMLGEPFLGRV